MTPTNDPTRSIYTLSPKSYRLIYALMEKVWTIKAERITLINPRVIIEDNLITLWNMEN